MFSVCNPRMWRHNARALLYGRVCLSNAKQAFQGSHALMSDSQKQPGVQSEHPHTWSEASAEMSAGTGEHAAASNSAEIVRAAGAHAAAQHILRALSSVPLHWCRAWVPSSVPGICGISAAWPPRGCAASKGLFVRPRADATVLFTLSGDVRLVLDCACGATAKWA